VYITFFDAQDLISQLRIKWKLHQINTEMEFLNNSNEKALEQINDLTNNQESLEKFAREQYKMKRENEDIFVIITEE
jgi:cell division protein FtsB